MRYQREDGSFVSQEDMDYLQNRNGKPTASYANGGKMTPTKLWLLILATVLVVAGIVFAAIEVYQNNQLVNQNQQVIDWGKKESQQLREDLNNLKW